MVKVISLSNEAYERLKARKGERSFSELVIEITSEKPKKNLMDFFGMFKEDSAYWGKFKKEVRVSRNRAKLREARF